MVRLRTSKSRPDFLLAYYDKYSFIVEEKNAGKIENECLEIDVAVRDVTPGGRLRFLAILKKGCIKEGASGSPMMADFSVPILWFSGEGRHLGKNK